MFIESQNEGKLDQLVPFAYQHTYDHWYCVEHPYNDSIYQQVNAVLIVNVRISSSIAGSAVEEPTSSLRNQPTVDENATDSFDDPVYYWNDSWYLPRSFFIVGK